MSVIRKLLIQGIRSFDPQNQDIIEFYAPLTIIVGQNGCGKTTIIESLKYITTGELPPNSKGGAFIHDPKLAGENEVKAQVKLRFYNVSQRSMTCVRSILLTQKKSTVTQKTLEGALSFDATATEDKVSISSRCADLDAMLPEQLGVSKAVLENVIFCHQEESNWPLSEASVLKKKFDDIFAATRYTKALESIKATRKSQTVEIRVQRGELKHLEDKRGKAERVRVEYEKSTVAIHEFKVRIAEIQRAEEEVTGRIGALAEQLQEFMGLRTVVQGLDMSLEQKAASYEEMAANTASLDLGDAELGRLALQVAVQIKSQGSDIQAKRDHRDQLKAQIAVLAATVLQATEEKSALQSAQRSLEMKVAGRKEAVGEICRATTPAIEAPAGDAEQQAAQCIARLEELLAAAEADRQALRRDAEDSERRLQAQIAATQAQINGFDVAAATCDKQAAAGRQEAQALRLKHASLGSGGGSGGDVQCELDAERAQLASAQEQGAEAVYGEKTRVQRTELASVAEEIAQLNAEMARSNQQADTRARLALARSEAAAHGTRIAEGEAAAGAGLAAHRPREGTQHDRTAPIADAVRAKKQAAAAFADTAKAAHAGLASTRARLDMARQALVRQTQDAAARRRRIADACGADAFDGVYAGAQAELGELMELAGHYKSASSMYRAYIQKIEADHACPVCMRGWPCAADEERLVAKLRLDYTAAPAELLRIAGDIERSERRLEELGALRSAVRDVAEWDSGGRAALDAQVAELAARAQELAAQADDADMEAAVMGADVDALDALLAQARELAALEAARSQAERQAMRLEHELQATGSAATADELQAQVAALQVRDTVARRELERLAQERMRRQKEIGFRQDAVRALQDRLALLARQAEERAALLRRIGELDADAKARDAEQLAAHAQAAALAPQLRQGQAALDAFRSDAREREAQVDRRARGLVQAKDRLAMLTREIDDTRRQLACPPGERRYASRLDMAAARLDELQVQAADARELLDAIAQELLESDRAADRLAARQREVSDNVRLRANLAEQAQLRERLREAREKQAHLERQLSAIYDDGSDDDQETGNPGVGRKRQRQGQGQAQNMGARLQRRREELNARLAQLTSERAGLQGEVKQLEDQARRLQAELATDFQSIDQRYVHQLVQCKTEELAHSDLETYGKALDAAIMRYHSLKMQDINKIIRELWINTYQGNDIDTIEIRSEIEGARNSRSHNYRVVMIKAGHAIDMRGRCSAGQKVLACLIIRLALAETFSVNCGILALDEPTTNLDQENIDSLARSLARIIKSRQEQRNFQLIVITHDEIFMQLLGKSEYADYYWRVYKDENQCSVFARRPIANN
ncbi:DNA repair protein rad50 [Kickxella alabastrina]|nr:DNA repair protein rad50 [Kickxella alabastrina]